MNTKEKNLIKEAIKLAIRNAQKMQYKLSEDKYLKEHYKNEEKEYNEILNKLK